jgi:hypothetical protein
MARNREATFVAIKEYINKIVTYGEVALTVAKATIKDETYMLFDNMKNATPVRTGNLKNSIRIYPNSKGTYHGYGIDYDGYDANGVAYSKIARSLNKGRKSGVSKNGRKFGALSGNHFIDFAIAKLKGMDNRINDNIDKAINEFENKEQ